MFSREKEVHIKWSELLNQKNEVEGKEKEPEIKRSVENEKIPPQIKKQACEIIRKLKNYYTYLEFVGPVNEPKTKQVYYPLYVVNSCYCLLFM